MSGPTWQSAPAAGERGFWETRPFLIAFILLAAVPLLWPNVPPLIDLPGHIGRYRIQLDLESRPDLAQYFTFQWSLIGNLGIDLLIVPLSKLFGLELAVKLIVLSIPPMTVAGFLWVAREVHGRISPIAFFAAPFAYAYPFMFGFANFALSMAFAFLAFGLWLRLARLGRFRLRAALFVPISCLIWVTHTFGWGTLGLMAFSAELIRQHDKGHGFIASGMRSAVHCLPMALPVVPMLLWRTGHVGGLTEDWFNIPAKIFSLVVVLRDRWLYWDGICLTVTLLLIFLSIRSKGIAFSRNLTASALFLAFVFVLLPRVVFGSAYADMRLAPYIFAVALLAPSPRDWSDLRLVRSIALAGVAFVGLRTAGTTISFWLYDREWDGELAALEHVPPRSRLVVLTGRTCGENWKTPRIEHLASMALVRGASFANSQFSMAGAQLLNVRYPEAGDFVTDPSHVIIPARCVDRDLLQVEEALQRLPRQAFDYVWLIKPPTYDPRLTDGLELVWLKGESRLFRVPRQPPLAAEPAA
jgi:hypothetical protein